MAKGIPVDPQIKAEIVKKIRDEGMKVSEASTLYDVSAKSIYTWSGVVTQGNARRHARGCRPRPAALPRVSCIWSEPDRS